MKKKTKRDYIAKLEIYDLEKLSNRDVRILCKWLVDISKFNVKSDNINAEDIASYKLMK